MHNYKDADIDELFPDCGYGPVADFYVYSRENNPDGVTKGTFVQFVGTAEHYTEAKNIEAIVQATAKVLMWDEAAVGLAVVEKYNAI